MTKIKLFGGKALFVALLYTFFLAFSAPLYGQHEGHDHSGHDHSHDHKSPSTAEEEISVQMEELQHLDTSHGHSHGEDLNLFETLLDILKHTIMISFFVLVMMLLIEYITVRTKGSWGEKLSKKPWRQILFGALLGLIPGCLGTYVAVSLYVHRMLSFAALVTVMIATSGDETFIMLALAPEHPSLLWMLLILAGIGLVAGLLIHLVVKSRSLMVLPNNHLKVHSHDPECSTFDRSLFSIQLRKISFVRAMLLAGGLLFLIFLLAGEIGPEAWNWMKIAFLIVTLIGLFIAVTVPDHFLEKHLWGHVIKKHFPRIFGWTFVAFLVIQLLIPLLQQQFPSLQIEEWFDNNLWVLLVVALLVGVIPDSGPHLFFLVLFINGNIPMSILIANSIVQDGHGALPLLAESGRSFLWVKGVNVLVGLIIGILGLVIGF